MEGLSRFYWAGIEPLGGVEDDFRVVPEMESPRERASLVWERVVPELGEWLADNPERLISYDDISSSGSEDPMDIEVPTDAQFTDRLEVAREEEEQTVPMIVVEEEASSLGR